MSNDSRSTCAAQIETKREVSVKIGIIMLKTNFPRVAFSPNARMIMLIVLPHIYNTVVYAQKRRVGRSTCAAPIKMKREVGIDIGIITLKINFPRVVFTLSARIGV